MTEIELEQKIEEVMEEWAELLREDGITDEEIALLEPGMRNVTTKIIKKNYETPVQDPTDPTI